MKFIIVDLRDQSLTFPAHTSPSAHTHKKKKTHIIMMIRIKEPVMKKQTKHSPFNNVKIECYSINHVSKTKSPSYRIVIHIVNRDAPNFRYLFDNRPI